MKTKLKPEPSVAAHLDKARASLAGAAIELLRELGPELEAERSIVL